MFLTGLCVLALGLPALAETPAEPDPLEKQMEVIRKLITNAQMKLRRGVAGVAQTGEAPAAVRTPGNLCCGDNIERIHAALDTVRGLVRDRGTCFEQKWDRGGAESVVLANRDLRALSVGIQVFSEAMEPQDTYGALDGTLRAYLNLKRRLDVLPACADGVSQPTP